jgi:hypothetical protein
MKALDEKLAKLASAQGGVPRSVGPDLDDGEM